MKTMIEKYLKAAKDKDVTALPEIFAENAVYAESNGNEYYGLTQITEWFKGVIAGGEVLEWPIKQIITDGNKAAAEWHFNYQIYGADVFEFDGVSIVEVNEEGKITSWREFAVFPAADGEWQ